ncbi:MAG: chromosomal replication initiator protein DnaA [Candidatus Latescibacterota bacterium]
MPWDPAEIWARCLLNIERKLSKQSFETWFRPTKCSHFEPKQMVVDIPSTFFGEWLEEHFLSLIQSAVLEVTSHVPHISFYVVEDEDSSGFPPFNKPGEIPPNLQTFPQEKISLNPRYTFDTFVVGNSNQLATAAARAVAEDPGTTSFNPLLIYSGVGLGKTHILQGIAHHCLNKNPAQRVIYVSSEKFFLDFIDSIQHNKSSAFSKIYRNADLLLVDDVQFLVNKETTQEEFFHTFNALHQNGKQIVLTTDRPPSELKGLEERLISRFQWGLVADIQSPNLETRIAILQKKAATDGIELPREVITFIAEHITSNVRELEGTLIRLLASASISNQDITLEFAQSLFKYARHTPSNIITIEAIQAAVCTQYNTPQDLIVGETRKKSVVQARQIAMYMAKTHTKSSLKTIGLHFGGRDHSTVIHACKAVQEKLKHDATFREELKKLPELFK